MNIENIKSINVLNDTALYVSLFKNLFLLTINQKAKLEQGSTTVATIGYNKMILQIFYTTWVYNKSVVCLMFRVVRENGFKALQYLENDLKQLDMYNKSYYKDLESQVNVSQVGLFKRSEIGQPMKLYFYMSQQDLLVGCGKRMLFTDISETDVYTNQYGHYFSICLETTNTTKYKLPDHSLLCLNEQMFDELVIFFGYLKKRKSPSQTKTIVFFVLS